MVVVILLFIFSVVRYLLNFLKVPYSLLPFLGSALLLSTGEGRRTLTKDDDELFHLEIRLRVGGMRLTSRRSDPKSLDPCRHFSAFEYVHGRIIDNPWRRA
jgi:hypothetical protein